MALSKTHRTRWTARPSCGDCFDSDAVDGRGTAHHWAREIRALGHDVRLVLASYVKPYAKRGKTDTADAKAICEVGASGAFPGIPCCGPRSRRAPCWRVWHGRACGACREGGPSLCG